MSETISSSASLSITDLDTYITDYFASCQLPLPASQYETTAQLHIVTIAPLDAKHPFRTDYLKSTPLPKWTFYQITVSAGSPFFPNGGGQPSDQGTISFTLDGSQYTLSILGVYRFPDTTMTHVVAIPPKDSSIPHAGIDLLSLITPHLSTLECTLSVDFSRRFFYMTNHTGQHLISAIFSRCFDLPTAGWTCGTYIPSLTLSTVNDPLSSDSTSKQSIQIASDISSSLSCIDFTGVSSIRIPNIIELVVIAAQGSKIPIPRLRSDLLQLLALSPLTLPSQLTTSINNIKTYNDAVTLSNTLLGTATTTPHVNTELSTLVTTLQSISSTPHDDFRSISNMVEVITNILVQYGSPVDIHVEGAIAAPEGDQQQPEQRQSTRSMGVTSSSTVNIPRRGDISALSSTASSDNAEAHETITLRANEKKVAKYGGAPKRYIQLGLIEMSPCCGTHISDLREIGQIVFWSQGKNGKNTNRIYFSPSSPLGLVAHWSYNTISAVKAQLSTKISEIPQSVSKIQNNAQRSSDSLRSVKELYFNQLAQSIVTKACEYIAPSDQSTALAPFGSRPIIYHTVSGIFTGQDLLDLYNLVNEQYSTVASQQTPARSSDQSPLLVLAPSDETARQGTPVSKSDPSSVPGQTIFFIGGPESLAKEIKSFGMEFAALIKANGGGRPGSFQGKIPIGTDMAPIHNKYGQFSNWVIM